MVPANEGSAVAKGRLMLQGLNWERTCWALVIETQGDTLERQAPDLFSTARLGSTPDR